MVAADQIKFPGAMAVGDELSVYVDLMSEGRTSMKLKAEAIALAIVALICFFPITVRLLDGLRSTPPELLKLMRSMGFEAKRNAEDADFVIVTHPL